MTKVLVIQTPEYDFNSATLIEGLSDLAGNGEVEFFCTEGSNYAFINNKHDFRTYNENHAIEYGKEADLIIVTSNQRVREHIADSINRPEKTIYIDGEDIYHYKKDPAEYPLYFKREMLLEIKHPDNVRPFPFAAEKRYFSRFLTDWQDRIWDISCMFGPHDSTKLWREDIENNLRSNFGDKDRHTKTIIGSLYGGKNRTIIDTGGRDHEDYYAILSKSKFSVDAYGAFKCNASRFWEILATGACLVTQEVLIHMPYKFEDGKTIVEFSSMEEMVDKMNYFLSNTEYAQQIALSGYNHMINHHTTKMRVSQLLLECQKNGILS